MAGPRARRFASRHEPAVRSSTAQRTSISATMREGDFSELLGPNIFYSGTRQLVDPVTRAPIAGNIIPKGQLSQNGLGILKAWPDPNLATPIGGNGNWFAAAAHTYDQRKD